VWTYSDAQHAYDTTKDETYLHCGIIPLEVLLMNYKCIECIIVKDSVVNAIYFGTIAVAVVQMTMAGMAMANQMCHYGM
jgi:hypothetical protein